MCGRYTLRASRKKIADAFEARPQGDAPELFERYNLAPQQDAPIVRQEQEGRVVAMARWGLIPGWTKDPEQLKSTPINARADRVAESPMFKHALRRGRCLIPATGFYEWQSQGLRQPKQPYLIRQRDGGLFAFAGLWERWQDEVGEPLDTFTIITTAPNELVKPLHERMPVILPTEAWPTWLDAEQPDAQTLTDVLGPSSAEGWEAVPVSRYVNKPEHDDPACIEPTGASSPGQSPSAPKGRQGRLF